MLNTIAAAIAPQRNVVQRVERHGHGKRRATRYGAVITLTLMPDT